ncbi:hypothetical protein CcaverHIS002_0113060 [Cutaneotrichosporon cavernicola]|uniref:Uncharacterized protein n=1 Tax=Cutaneotrichosporon cavernicola TaxID=279322 RepID=A0AA48I7M2_9TREE|nr:uncharacterized protein CcaverHIS019_0112930 [Cutaneotrichosporon cavernicola]BEI80777.1 hypothetical protein CcaverHIS002_0113060 [Cutaneotrichosporon cavernicola]BEI88575.1 hypothetical protein CcaverHIS019_0112930 [Cutaneotrichosporon cavernicola]BEI96348.1 hypothetical protein CcaverHIS631_0112970 [Cutaneotrichosporon cavernicola]BEJ04120.1 hypothetical protein CcaverHIS641_0112950 [Cutaneotrichosporon cavernicola]
MRLALTICAACAVARAQLSADESAIASAATSISSTPTPTEVPISAAVLFPSASSSWSHNGTAYLKYSLPDGVSLMSVAYVLANDNSNSQLKVGNSQLDDFKPYFLYTKLMRSTAQPAGAGTYWIKWIPAYGENPDDVPPGTGYTVGVAYQLDATQPHQFVWSAPFEIRADGADTLPADVSAYPANATMSNWNPPNGPTMAVGSGGHGLTPITFAGFTAMVVLGLWPL